MWDNIRTRLSGDRIGSRYCDFNGLSIARNSVPNVLQLVVRVSECGMLSDHIVGCVARVSCLELEVRLAAAFVGADFEGLLPVALAAEHALGGDGVLWTSCSSAPVS